MARTTSTAVVATSRTNTTVAKREAAQAEARKTQLAAARAEAKELRKKREAAEAAAAAHAQQVQPEPAAVNIEDMIADLKLPSAKRVLVGFVLSIATAGAVGYGIGIVLSYILAGITVLFGTGLVAFVLTALAWIVALIAGWKLGGWIGGKVFSAIVLPDGLADQSMQSLSNAASATKERVSGWFSKPSVVTQVA